MEAALPRTSRRLVIDVSHWDGDVDFETWKAKRGLWGVIVKAGGNERRLGRYSDSMFERNYERAKAAGLHVGAYYYTVSTATADAEADARHFVSLLEGKQFDLPVYMDVEDAKQLALSKRQLTDVIKAFCNACAVRGYKSGIYTGGSAWLYNMESGELLPFADWIAWWKATWPDSCGDIGMWQQGGMRLSDGDIVFDDVPGYTDLDWCRVDYPARIESEGLNGYAQREVPTVTVKNRLSYADAAAEVAEHIANHDAHGYSQPRRAGDGTIETITLSDGTQVNIHGGAYDCSEMGRMVYAAVGVLEWDYWTSYTWSVNLDEVFTAHGFERLPFDSDSVKRGDILWKKGHVGIALGDGLQADAHGDEYGGIDGPNEGDQTGHEIEVRDLQWYWSYIYRYAGPPRPEELPVVMQLETEPRNDYGLYYRMHSQTAGWLPAVRDGQTAGTEGLSKRGEAIKITPPEGYELEVMTHVQGIGTLWYEGVRKGESSGTGTSKNDPIMGTVGQARRLEAVRIRITKRPNDGKRIRLQGHVQGIGWMDPVGEDEWCGTIGEARRLEAVRMWFEDDSARS